MARPVKYKIDYFPHFANGNSRTISILEKRFGNDGYAFWFKLLELLCDSDRQVYDCNNALNWEFLLTKTGVSEVSATEILETLANLGKIDSELWKNKVIWVQTLVDNLEYTYKRRNIATPTKPQINGLLSTENTVDGSLCQQKPDRGEFLYDETAQKPENINININTNINNNTIHTSDTNSETAQSPTAIPATEPEYIPTPVPAPTPAPAPALVQAQPEPAPQPEKHRRSKVFIKPTVEQVAEYCAERKNGIDAANFVDFYESKGWLVGKAPMKDWKASVRTWERRHSGETYPQPRSRFPTQNDILQTNKNTLRELDEMFGNTKPEQLTIDEQYNTQNDGR